jgi:hypothetical protein
VLWKNSARHDALLLTEQCGNYCLMCSQPPKDRDDSWLFDRARKVVSLLSARVSDWKNDYLDICRSCSVRDACGGVFTTGGNRLSQHLRPVP